MLKYFLKFLRKIYKKISGESSQIQKFEQNPDYASKLIYDALSSKEPFMIARFGAFELSTIANYLGVKKINSILEIDNKGHPL